MGAGASCDFNASIGGFRFLVCGARFLDRMQSAYPWIIFCKMSQTLGGLAMIKLVHSRSHVQPTSEVKKRSKPQLKLIKSNAAAPQARDKKEAGVSEFYVHAVLQAARAVKLGLDLDSAKSWALNRAIFYEAAKKGYFQRGRRAPLHGGGGGSSGAPNKKSSNFGQVYSLGNEKAYAVETHDGGVRFVIGGKAQSPDTFDKQIRKRFPKWKLVWSEAMELMNEAGPMVLKSPSRFHSQIYKRWRDIMRVRWPLGQSAREALHAA
jgi:hypothetical protein